MKFLINLFLTLILGAAATILVACQGRETVKEVVREPIPKSSAKTDGGQDSGGGDCVRTDGNCFPIEDFHYTVRTDAAFVELIQPLIQKIAAISPKLAADLNHISQERNWYRIPVELNSLPRELKGIYFHSEQMALQNMRAIYIDDRLFGPIPLNSKARLILHELVMGVRLMEFQSDLDVCLAGAALELNPNGNRESWRQKRNNCYHNTNPLASSKSVQLEKGDYDNVRALTTMLYFDLEKMEVTEIENWLKMNHFRSYNNRYY